MPNYTGSCHCGAVKFKVEMDLASVMSCNCSYCSRAGTLLAFTPESHFSLLTPENALEDYLFGGKSIHHRFCKTCGITPFGHSVLNGQPTRAINARCLEGIDLASIPVEHFDGKSL